MAKPKKNSFNLKILTSNIVLLIILFIVTIGGIFFYKTYWLAEAQNSNNNSPSAIITCVNNTNGNMRFVDSADKCKKEEKSLALQPAISNLISDVEVVWYQPPGDRNTNFESGVKTSCPEGKTAIGGGSTEVVMKSAPFGDSISGSEGKTNETATGWEVIPYRYLQGPVVYAICAKVNK